MFNPHQVTKDFEAALCEYTGAPYAVAVNSCTMALLLAVAWQLRRKDWRLERIGVATKRWNVEIPRRTYCSVPMSIIHAGGWPTFRDEDWQGAYQLKPLPVWDSARYFTSGMYKGKTQAVTQSRCGEDSITLVDIQVDCSGQMVCVSFHASKTLGIEQGGAILHDNPEADRWLRMARFDGRQEGMPPADQENWPMVGWHCYLNPSTAAQGLLKLHSLPRNNAPLPNDLYPDLSLMEIFQ